MSKEVGTNSRASTLALSPVGSMRLSEPPAISSGMGKGTDKAYLIVDR